MKNNIILRQNFKVYCSLLLLLTFLISKIQHFYNKTILEFFPKFSKHNYVQKTDIIYLGKVTNKMLLISQLLEFLFRKVNICQTKLKLNFVKSSALVRNLRTFSEQQGPPTVKVICFAVLLFRNLKASICTYLKMRP